MNTEEVLELIGKVLNDDSFPLEPEYLCCGNPLSDAVSVQADKFDLPSYLAPSRIGAEGYKGYIHQMLGHIPVNPTDRDNTDALLNMYVTSQDSGTHPFYVNWSPEGIREFVDQMIAFAENERVYHHRSEGRLILIHGPKGCGKTFLLNHILARFSQHFDDRKTLWVRVNLAADFSGSLLHWIYAQTTKIVFRYYDPTSQYYDHAHPKKIALRVREYLEQYVNDAVLDPDLRDKLSKNVSRMRQVFQHKEKGARGNGVGIDEPLSPDLVDEVLARAVFHFALGQGYSIIVALDGLDRLEATAFQYRRFANLWHQTMRLAHASDPFRAALIAITRTNTLSEAPDSGLAQQYTRQADIPKQVKTIDFKRILNIRETYLMKRVPEIAVREGWRLPDWPGHLNRFFEFLTAREAEASRSEDLDSLGENRREQMEAVQYTYFEYLKKEKEPSYRLRESLCKAGRCFPPRYYHYPKSIRTTSRRRGMTTLSAQLFPCIFMLPYEIGHAVEKPKSKLWAPNPILLNIRMLQLLHGHDYRIFTSKPSPSRLKVREFIILCSKLFGYGEEMIKCAIEENEQFQIVEIRSPHFPAPSELRDMQIYTTTKSRYFLRELLYDVAYLNLAAMRVPILPRALSLNVPYFRAATIDLLPPYGVSIPEWVAIKVINTVALYKMLVAVNEYEKRIVDGNLSGLKVRLSRTVQAAIKGGYEDIDGMFDFPDRMSKRVLLQVERMLNSVEDHVRTSIYEQLLTWQKTWGQK